VKSELPAAIDKFIEMIVAMQGASCVGSPIRPLERRHDVRISVQVEADIVNTELI